MALTSARQILNKKILGGGDVQELEVEVAALSASVLTIGEKLENVTEASTTERVVGKWIDGSDIYEKTYSDVMPTITDNNFSIKTISTSSDNIDLVVDYDIFVIQVVGGKQITVKTPYLTNAGLQLKGFYDGNNNAITISSNAAAYSECVFYATLRYIKAAAESSKKKTTRKSTK